VTPDSQRRFNMGYSVSNFKDNGEVETKTFDYYDKSGQYKEREFNDDVVHFLKEEEKKLRMHLNDCLSRKDTGMYKNLIQAYEKVVELIKKYDWQLMYSEYDIPVDSEHKQREVAIWEQNGDENIRNHKVWSISEKGMNVYASTEDITINNGGIKLDDKAIDEITNKIIEKLKNNKGIRL